MWFSLACNETKICNKYVSFYTVNIILLKPYNKHNENWDIKFCKELKPYTRTSYI